LALKAVVRIESQSKKRTLGDETVSERLTDVSWGTLYLPPRVISLLHQRSRLPCLHALQELPGDLRDPGAKHDIFLM